MRIRPSAIFALVFAAFWSDAARAFEPAPCPEGLPNAVERRWPEPVNSPVWN
jgi:hypothetical protein